MISCNVDDRFIYRERTSSYNIYKEYEDIIIDIISIVTLYIIVDDICI